MRIKLILYYFIHIPRLTQLTDTLESEFIIMFGEKKKQQEKDGERENISIKMSRENDERPRNKEIVVYRNLIVPISNKQST